MSKNILNWKRYYVYLKALAGIALIGLTVALFLATRTLIIALKNTNGPQNVTLEQLIDGTVGVGRYVTVQGLAVYGAGYPQTPMQADTQTADVHPPERLDKLSQPADAHPIDDNTHTYYALVDTKNGHMLIVKAATPVLANQTPVTATIVGVTQRANRNLRHAIQADLSGFNRVGLKTTPKVILSEGSIPGSAARALTTVVVIAILIGLSVLPFLYRP